MTEVLVLFLLQEVLDDPEAIEVIAMKVVVEVEVVVIEAEEVTIHGGDQILVGVWVAEGVTAAIKVMIVEIQEEKIEVEAEAGIIVIVNIEDTIIYIEIDLEAEVIKEVKKIKGILIIFTFFNHNL